MSEAPPLETRDFSKVGPLLKEGVRKEVIFLYDDPDTDLSTYLFGDILDDFGIITKVSLLPKGNGYRIKFTEKKTFIKPSKSYWSTC